MHETCEVLDLLSVPEDRRGETLRERFHGLAPENAMVVYGDGSPSSLLAELQCSQLNILDWWLLETSHDGWKVLLSRRSGDPHQHRTLSDFMCADHARLERLYGHLYRAAEEGDTPKARRLMKQFALGLRHHIKVEEEKLMPLMIELQRPHAESEVKELHEDHERIQEALAEAEAALHIKDGMDGAKACAALTQMRFLLEGHNNNEERYLYPECDHGLRNDDCEELIRRIQAEQG